jgi:hypothetical protein
MRRISIVSIVPIIAAAVMVGHVIPHLISEHRPTPPTTPPPSAAPANLPPKPWGAGSPAAPVRTAPPLVVRTCRLQPPLTDADWQPLLDALRPLVAREDRRAPIMARFNDDFVRRFEACGVDVLETSHDYVVIATPLGGLWTGARFRKTPHGWIALQMDGGDN